MDILFAPVYFLFAHNLLGTGLLAILGFFILRTLAAHKVRLPAFLDRYGFLLLLGAAFLNLFFGTFVAVHLVHWLGSDAHGVVLDEYSTGTQHNDQRVYGHHVLLSLPDGRTVQESFRDDTFNVYPPHNGTIYPTEGEHFDARYLPHFPSAFIILSVGPNEFARNRRCNALGNTLAVAQRKLQFAPGNATFRDETSSALESYRRAGCDADAH